MNAVDVLVCYWFFFPTSYKIQIFLDKLSKYPISVLFNVVISDVILSDTPLASVEMDPICFC